MSDPEVPRNDGIIQRVLTRILEGVTVPQGDLRAVVQYVSYHGLKAVAFPP